MNDNKRIALNTIAIYVKLVITTIVSLITARYVLLALGQSDYGLYNVVGAIIVLINTIGTAMYTTTRRYINVEMGKGANGNPNKIFNISLLLHIGFALSFLAIAESLGLWYINNYLQVESEKMSDAHFVFQVSTIVACIGLINVPYQGLMNAFQKFWQISFIEIMVTVLKLILVLVLIRYEGNALRFYAITMSVLTFCSFVLYHIACRCQWKDIVRYKFYWDKEVYKEILIFNNYTAIGAASCLGRTQGSAMLINYFFGTMVNGALAIAYQVQSFVSLFAGNIVQAAAPQITQAYSSNNKERAFTLSIQVAKMTLLIMICIFFFLFIGLDSIFIVWLKVIPDGAVLLTRWVLIATLINAFLSTLYVYVQATGKVKWFQIVASTLELLVLPTSFVLFKLGFQPFSIFAVLVATTILNILLFLILLKKIEDFDSVDFIRCAYYRPFMVIAILVFTLLLVNKFISDSVLYGLLLAFIEMILAVATSYLIGLSRSEQHKVISIIKNKIKK